MSAMKNLKYKGLMDLKADDAVMQSLLDDFQQAASDHGVMICVVMFAKPDGTPTGVNAGLWINAEKEHHNEVAEDLKKMLEKLKQ